MCINIFPRVSEIWKYILTSTFIGHIVQYRGICVGKVTFTIKNGRSGIFPSRPHLPSSWAQDKIFSGTPFLISYMSDVRLIDAWYFCSNYCLGFPWLPLQIRLTSGVSIHLSMVRPLLESHFLTMNWQLGQCQQWSQYTQWQEMIP